MSEDLFQFPTPWRLVRLGMQQSQAHRLVGVESSASCALTLGNQYFFLKVCNLGRQIQLALLNGNNSFLV